jgi:hypothetical protein
MKYRKLRIAWSVGWGVLCLLVFEFWIRSYQRIDFLTLNVPGPIVVQVVSITGLVGASVDAISPGHWDWISARADIVDPTRGLSGQFDVLDENGDRTVIVPHWFLLVLSAAVASAPWLPGRFSLRALLIGMTVLAVLLGALVYAVRV